MFVIYFLFIILGTVISKTDSDVKEDILNGTKLIFTFLVFRHGDRTPVKSDLSFRINAEALAKISERYGYGQLTPRGQLRGYQIGQFIRSRYSSLLSLKYNQSEIYIRSTDITRTKMTVLTAMAAVYPPTDDNWHRDINWTPVPYSTVDAANDYMMAYANCAKYIAATYNVIPKLPQYEEVLKKLSRITGLDFSNDLYLAYILHDYFVCQNSLGLPIDDAVKEIWSEIVEVASAIMAVTTGNEDNLHLLSGVLLSEFFNATSALINGEDVPRVRVYSAHDINVYIMIAASKIRKNARPGVPNFGSTFALELRRVEKTGQYVVLAVYLPDPEKQEILYLPIEGCSNILCDLNIFKSITSKFVLDEDSWKKSCKADFEMVNIKAGFK